MALVYFQLKLAKNCSNFANLFKHQKYNSAAIFKIAQKHESTHTKVKPSENEIVKSVFISQSRDIFTNLALEDWLYKNFDFTYHHVMLLWRNNPCVVVGRHQNPWIEANFNEFNQQGVDLARRNSGGGSVYHDEGNLNVTFFAPSERYNRKNNLTIIAKTLEKEWKLSPEINKKEDIVIDTNYKISGTASKLGRPNSYHHCTLLVDVNKDRLVKALAKNQGVQFKTTATSSVPSPTVNLIEIEPRITMERLMSSVGWEYLRRGALTHEDKGWDLVSQQRGFQYINPTDDWFPGLDKIRSELHSWEWIYGKTPKFVATKEYEIGGGLNKLSVCVEVEKGIVHGVMLGIPPGVAWGRLTGEVDLITTARGQRFSPKVFDLIEEAIKQQGIHFEVAKMGMAA